MNVAELAGLLNATVCIQTYDWVTYLGQYFKKTTEVKTYYHFRFNKECSGNVFYKQFWDSEERWLILKTNNLPKPGQLPTIVNPQGISRGRAEYLFMEIREFWRDGTENLVAPQVTEL